MYALLFVLINVAQTHFAFSCRLVLFKHVILIRKIGHYIVIIICTQEIQRPFHINGELKLWPSSSSILSNKHPNCSLKFCFLAFRIIYSLKIQKHVQSGADRLLVQSTFIWAAFFRNKSYLSFLVRGISL